MNWLLLVFALTAAAGCASRQRALQAQPSSSSNPGAATTAQAAAQPLLTSTAEQAQHAGAGPLETVATGIRGAGETLTGLAVLPQGRCALLYARAGATVVDLDLHAFGDDGTQFGSDEGPDARPTLLVCATEQTSRLFLSAKVAQGLGLVSIGLHDVDATVRVRVSDAMGVRNYAPKVEANDHGWPTLDDDIAQHLAQLGGDFRDVRRVALPVDARVPTHFDADLPEHQCLSVLVLPDDPYLQLDLQVKDEQGRILSHGVETARQRSALICNDGPAAHLVFELRPQSGQGFAVVALNVGERVTSASATARAVVNLGHPTLDVARDKVIHHLAVDLALGQLQVIPIASRGCQRYLLTDATGRTSLAAGVRGFSPTGRLLGEGNTAPGVGLLLCQHGQVVFELDADEYSRAAQVLVLQAESTPAFYLNAPLAASRADYRNRLLQPPGLVGSQLVSRPISLTAEQPFSTPVTLSKGTCAAFSVGVESSDGALDVRLIDAHTQELLARGQGQTSAGVLLCQPTERTATLEVVRSGASTSTVLVHTQWPTSN